MAVLVWYFWKANQKSKAAKEKREAVAKAYPYEGMRNIALNTSPGAILANVPENEIYVYAAVMDWDMGSDIVTLVAQVTGEANFYVKSGGGMVGTGKHINVSEAAQGFTAMAQEYLKFTVPVEDTPLPLKNYVRFYFLTNIGKFTATEDYRNIDNKTSQWTPLFTAANNVIAEMRKTVIGDAKA